MTFDLDKNFNNYLCLHADCIAVKGASRSAIYDLTRSEIILFPRNYYDVLEYLTSDKIGILIKRLQSENEQTKIGEFIDYLEQNELITFVADRSLFPRIEPKWDIAGRVYNAVIDVDTTIHDFEKVFAELNELGCQFVQIRGFSTILRLDNLRAILRFAHDKSIQSVDVILRYEADIRDDLYIQFLEEHPIVTSLIIHGCPQARKLIADYSSTNTFNYNVSKEVNFVTQMITSQIHCGIISIKTLTAPSVSNFFETKLYNGCLNGKVSIDVSGEIRNCPSMKLSFGNIKQTSLISVLDRVGFKDNWTINKDQIDICKDCEFRYACSDCRAYLENPENIYSKPLKCGYNPYTCEWEDWSCSPLKKRAIQHYGMEEIIVKDEHSLFACGQKSPPAPSTLDR
jgi:SPASM domain peptide maturase of grasp-with-spasm system